MTDIECDVFALKLAGHSDRIIRKRLASESPSLIEKAIKKVGAFNPNTKPIPRITCYYEKQDDGMYKWWQDDWFHDQWDTLDEYDFRVKEHTAIMLNHEVIQGLPE